MRFKQVNIFLKAFGSLAHNKRYIHVSLYHHFNKCVLHSSFFFPSKFCPKPSGSSPCFSPGREAIAEEQEQRREFYLAFDLLDRFFVSSFSFDIISDLQKSYRNTPEDSPLPFIQLPQIGTLTAIP